LNKSSPGIYSFLCKSSENRRTKFGGHSWLEGGNLIRAAETNVQDPALSYIERRGILGAHTKRRKTKRRKKKRRKTKRRTSKRRQLQNIDTTKRRQLQNVESQNVDSAKMHRMLQFYIVSPCKMNF
jgi:hypothetical protein